MENKSKKYPNGSKFQTNNCNEITIIGKSDMPIIRKNRSPEYGYYLCQFEDGTIVESMGKEIRSGSIKNPNQNLTFDKKNTHLKVKNNLDLKFYNGRVPNSTRVIPRNGEVIIQGNCIPIDNNIEVKIEKRKYIPRTYINNNDIRMAILSGDKHFLYQSKNAIDILEQICDDYSNFIDEFIDGGDGINNNALSKFIDTEKIKYTLYEEMSAFEEHLYKMKNILPNAKFVIVEDNHFHLRKKRFLSENPAMEGLLKDIDFPFDEIIKHGVPYFPFGQDRIGVIHGLKTNDNFTKGHSDLFKEDIINFHTHGSQHYTCKNGSKALNKQAQKMWGMPSMCMQMDYTNGSPTRSNTGFGVLWYNLKLNLYDIHYVFVENGSALYNGKTYDSRVIS